MPISTKRGTDICISVVQGSVTNRWSKDGRKIRLHSMIFPGENRRGRDSFSTGYLIPPSSIFFVYFDIRRFIFPPDIIYVWILQNVKARRSCEKLISSCVNTSPPIYFPIKISIQVKEKRFFIPEDSNFSISLIVYP